MHVIQTIAEKPKYVATVFCGDVVWTSVWDDAHRFTSRDTSWPIIKFIAKQWPDISLKRTPAPLTIRDHINAACCV